VPSHPLSPLRCELPRVRLTYPTLALKATCPQNVMTHGAASIHPVAASDELRRVGAGHRSPRIAVSAG
jgi:hypothetical protein